MDDPIVVGSIIGVFANIPKVISNFIFYQLHFSRYHCWHMTVKTLISADWKFNFQTLVIGGLLDLILAATFGVGLVYFYRFLGSKYLIFKGLAYTFGTWLFFCLMIGGKLLDTPRDVYHSFFDHLFWGVLAIGLVVKYGRKVIERKSW